MSTPHIVVAKVSRMLMSLRSRTAKATREDGWFALPGNRLELNGSGFEIRMERRHIDGQDQLAYCGFSPEGAEIAYTANNLKGLQQILEQQARARQEFDL